jgi:hypothetical protein
MPLRPAPMTGGPRQGPRCLFSIAWTAQYLHLSPGKQQAPTEVQGPMRNRKWVKSFRARPSQRSQEPTLTPAGPSHPSCY